MKSCVEDDFTPWLALNEWEEKIYLLYGAILKTDKTGTDNTGGYISSSKPFTEFSRGGLKSLTSTIIVLKKTR